MEHDEERLSEELSGEIERKLSLGHSLRQLSRSVVTFRVSNVPAGVRVTVTWLPDAGPEQLLEFSGSGSKKVKPQPRATSGRWVASAAGQRYVCSPASGSVWFGTEREKLTVAIVVRKAGTTQQRAFSSAFSSAFG